MVCLGLEFVSTATNNFQRSVVSLANWRKHELPSTNNLTRMFANGRTPAKPLPGSSRKLRRRSNSRCLPGQETQPRVDLKTPPQPESLS
jgi:hypothetical protein